MILIWVEIPFPRITSYQECSSSTSWIKDNSLAITNAGLERTLYALPHDAKEEFLPS